MASRGICAAGHPLTAEAGAAVLREGGNAVDAAIGAMLTSWVAEPLLTGPGAGGYLLVAGAGEEPTPLDLFVAPPGAGAPRRGGPAGAGGRASGRSRSTWAPRGRSSTSPRRRAACPATPRASRRRRAA